MNSLERCESIELVVRFSHSHPASADIFANVRIKGPLANISFQWSFGFDIRVADSRLSGARMSNPLHWSIPDERSECFADVVADHQIGDIVLIRRLIVDDHQPGSAVPRQYRKTGCRPHHQ